MAIKILVLYLLVLVLSFVSVGCSALPKKAAENTDGRYQNKFEPGRAGQSLLAAPAIFNHHRNSDLNPKEILLPCINWSTQNRDGTKDLWGLHFKIRSIAQNDNNISSFSDLTRKLKDLVPILMLEYTF